MALNIQDLGVKFYSSKNYSEAIALANTEPGAICFVSDSTGNYIILDGKAFGSGAGGGGTSSGSGGGAVDSVNGLIGTVVITLSDLQVTVDLDGHTLKTLLDYFKADGTIVSNSFKVDKVIDGIKTNIVTIDENGISIQGNTVATQTYVLGAIGTAQELINASVLQTASELANQAEQNAKDYADAVLSSIYLVKGSVETYSDLIKISSPKLGWVYNVISAVGIPGLLSYTPAGTNYVYVEVSDTKDSKYPGYWDALGGTVDLSKYLTITDADSKIASAVSLANGYTDSKTGELSQIILLNTSAISSLQSAQSANTATITSLGVTLSSHATSIETNTLNITQISTQLTWQ